MLKTLSLTLSLLLAHDKSDNNALKDATETYIELQPLIIPVVKGDQVFAFVRLLIHVMTKDATSIHPYKPYEIILKDRFFADVYGALCDQWLPGQQPNQDTIEKRLQRVTDHVVGPDKLRIFVAHFYFYKPNKK